MIYDDSKVNDDEEDDLNKDYDWEDDGEL